MFYFPGDPKAQLHTLNQGKAMALTCLDILTDEHLLKEIRQEFTGFKQNSQWNQRLQNKSETFCGWVPGENRESIMHNEDMLFCASSTLM